MSVYRCGTCEAERSALRWQELATVKAKDPAHSTLMWPEKAALKDVGWTRPSDEAGWGPQYRDLSPESYPAYLQARSKCTWQSSGTLGQHNSAIATNHGFREYQPMSSESAMKQPIPLINTSVKVCTLPLEWTPDGGWTQWIITRVEDVEPRSKQGAYHGSYRTWGFLSPQNIDVILARPPPGTGDLFVVQSINTALDSMGGAISYPPLNTHHSNTFLYGTGQGGINGKTSNHFTSWLPTVSAMGSAERGMRHADFVECEPGNQDPNACSLISLEKGGTNVGFLMSNQTYEQTDSLYNLLGTPWKGHEDENGMWQADKIVLEFGRKYAGGPKGILHRTPFWGFDIAINQNGISWQPDATRASCGGAVCYGISVSWHVIRIPATMHIRSSWLHTHPMVPNEVFVLEGDVERMLPTKLVTACYAGGGCAEQLGGQHRGFRPMKAGPPYVEEHDVSLHSIGLTADEVLQHVLEKSAQQRAKNGRGPLRCQYKSRNIVVDGRVYTRAAARAVATAHRCDNWTLPTGSRLSLLVFSHPTAPERTDLKFRQMFSQHVRWYAYATT